MSTNAKQAMRRENAQGAEQLMLAPDVDQPLAVAVMTDPWSPRSNIGRHYAANIIEAAALSSGSKLTWHSHHAVAEALHIELAHMAFPVCGFGLLPASQIAASLF
jgi:hypothetical protein